MFFAGSHVPYLDLGLKAAYRNNRLAVRLECERIDAARLMPGEGNRLLPSGHAPEVGSLSRARRPATARVLLSGLNATPAKIAPLPRLLLVEQNGALAGAQVPEPTSLSPAMEARNLPSGLNAKYSTPTYLAASTLYVAIIFVVARSQRLILSCSHGGPRSCRSSPNAKA